MTLLDRYVLKKFFIPFLYCLIGFIAIWFVFDLSDNLGDYINGHASFGVLFKYYSTQVPEIIVIALPLATLLALLYSLSAMSRANEIISMLGAGRSVVRILIPLLLVGCLLSGITGYFNYEAAPHATGMKKIIVSEINDGVKRDRSIKGHLFRNREDFRTWFVAHMSVGGSKLNGVQIVQQDSNGNIIKQWYANHAVFDSIISRWSLKSAKYLEMNIYGEIVKNEIQDTILIDDWSETPWRISSSMLKADFLSVPELNDYLKYNADLPELRLAAYKTQWHYRWAMPVVCFLVVFVAAPCGIVYSRRGVLGGVATAIGLFFALVILSNLCVALGMGNRVPPAIAAWGPMGAFFLTGFFMLWMKSTNRDMPKLKFPRIQ